MSSVIFDISDRYFWKSAELDPIGATFLGISDHDHALTDFTLDGHAQREQLVRDTITELTAATDSSEIGDDDRLAAGVLRESLESSLMDYERGGHLKSIRAIASDAEGVRAVFDLMPTATAEDWSMIATRLAAVPAALAGLRESWASAIQRGIVTTSRQVQAHATQLDEWAGRDGSGFFPRFVAEARTVDGAPSDELDRVAAEASAALAETAHFLRQTYLPKAIDRDGCGAEDHEVARRRFLGMNVDPREAYEWGWDETMRLDEEIRRVGEEILPGATAAEVRHFLDTDESRVIHGEENLRDWLQQLMDEAMSFLIDGGHFAIDPKMRTVEAKIAPPGGAAAMYYTAPSQDLSRPGRTWYPANGRTVFPRWGEPTTAYHEGVPGHHLQVGVAVLERERLTRVQRTHFVSGHGEGWALYAERLMDEFGFLENPDYRLGYLYAQAFRAARVVVDLGVHNDYSIPMSSSWRPGEKWTAESMLEFMTERSSSDEAFNRSEVDRYLGWPAQAISYKLGERVWLAMRDEAKARHGASFDLATWHDRALKLGNLGLGLFMSEMRRF